MKVLTVYILEDERIIAMDYINLLSRNNIKNVRVFSDGEDLYKASLSEMPNLIIADLILKNKNDGIHFIEKLWEQHNVPVIFISGLDLSRYKEKYDPSKTVFFNKPVIEEELITEITRLLKAPPTNK